MPLNRANLHNLSPQNQVNPPMKTKKAYNMKQLLCVGINFLVSPESFLKMFSSILGSVFSSFFFSKLFLFEDSVDLFSNFSLSASTFLNLHNLSPQNQVNPPMKTKKAYNMK
jgi:hypothetical protein